MLFESERVTSYCCFGLVVLVVKWEDVLLLLFPMLLEAFREL